MKRIYDLNEIYNMLNEFDSSFYRTMENMNIDINGWADKIGKYGELYVKQDIISKKNIGLLIFYVNDIITYTSFLSYIAVKKEYQGKHVADEMILFWLKQAKKQGCKICRLEVDKKNEHAIYLYKKHGFEVEKSNADAKSYFMIKRI